MSQDTRPAQNQPRDMPEDKNRPKPAPERLKDLDVTERDGNIVKGGVPKQPDAPIDL